MTGIVTPSRWAVAQFGDLAAAVIERVVLGLVAGQQQAWRVQAAAASEGVTTRRPYGSLWDARIHTLAGALSDLEGFRDYHPSGAPYRLPVVNDRLLIPFRHSTTLGKPIGAARLENDVPRTVSREFGSRSQPTLFEPLENVAEDDRGAIDGAGLEDDIPVIYIAYVANADSDRPLAAWWGDAVAVDDDGRLHWSPERLPVDLVGRADGLVISGTASAGQSFNAGEEPALRVRPRPAPIDEPALHDDMGRSDVAERDE